MIGFGQHSPIYLAKGATDLQKSIHTLAMLVQAGFAMDPYNESLYVFCNGRRNWLKILKRLILVGVNAIYQVLSHLRFE